MYYQIDQGSDDSDIYLVITQYLLDNLQLFTK